MKSTRTLRWRGCPAARHYGAHDRAGIHSGDSIAVYPAWNSKPRQNRKARGLLHRLALALNTKVDQHPVRHLPDQVYVIEVNPRSSRTVPYLSKVTGIPMVDIATRVMLGEKLKDMPYGTGLAPISPTPRSKCLSSPLKLSDWTRSSDLK
ncbi:MAG: hypothetical protein ACLURV_11965 [Gallintestinimicrobium sp.]